MRNRSRQHWAEVFAEEQAALNKRRGDAGAQRSVVGLAISGGGIRSATFGLGVLESLKALNLLKNVDYLSTVSGGGFIGSWLSANCKRHPDWLEPKVDWTASIGHLRRYSNYLSPRVGFFSADTWSMVTIWLRNTLLIQTTVLLVIACVLLLPRPLFEMFRHWPSVGNWRWGTILIFVLGIVGIAGNQMRLTSQKDVPLLHARNWRVGLLLSVTSAAIAWAYAAWVDFSPFVPGEVSYRASAPVAVFLVLAGFALQPLAVKVLAIFWKGDDKPQQINYTQGWVQVVVVVPLMIAAYLVAAILWGEAIGAPGVPALNSFNTYGELVTQAWKFWPFPLSVVFVSFWLLSFCSIHSRRNTLDLFTAAWAPLVAVPVFHAMLCVVMLLLRQWAADPAAGAWKAFVWAPVLVTGAFVVAIIVLIGMMGRQSTDEVREWWSRLGAWLGIYATAWMVIAVSAVYGPQLVRWALEYHWQISLSTIAGWAATVAGGLFAGKSPSTNGKSSKSASDTAKEAIALVAPFVFIAGLLIGVAWAVDAIIQANGGGDWSGIGANAHALHTRFLIVSLIALAGAFVALLLMAARVDINQFSLNAFYRNRLVRCYLGATRFKAGERQPQNFTGFDGNDDVALADLASGPAPAGPLHLVNCALNLGGSTDLALHTRHSASFTLSALHCGTAYCSRDQSGKAEEIGYVRTGVFGGKTGAPTLGQAISVSGAAASPNMGYHTSPVTAFLLTLFNVRLGWWFPNPDKGSAERPTPAFSLGYLFAELFGGANDTSRFVMISDGGHFENLAAYELIRRRCGVVIISDGECDRKLEFGGLGTLIRMCEVDFGIRININVSEIRATGTPRWSRKRWAVGEIDYGPGHAPGILIYLKASMTGGEDTSVLQYKSSHPAFPHETTGDQFYGEDQFESYRELGREVALDAFALGRGQHELGTVAATILASERNAPSRAAAAG
jgi:hypothetical protein